jgi:peroxiredoxin
MRVLLTATAVLFAGAMVTADDLKLGDVVGDLQFKTLDGKDVKLADFRGEKGKILVIYFQSDKCPSAVRPNDLKKSIDRFPADKVQMLAAYSYHGDSEDGIKKYIDSNKVAWSGMWDTEHKLANHLGAKKVNTTYVLDKEGKLIYRGGWGSKKDALVEQAVEVALGAKKAAPASDGKFAG